MSMEAFFRQGFIGFENALDRQSTELTTMVDDLLARVAVVAGEPPNRPAFIGIGASLAALGAPVAHLRAHGIAAWRANAAEVDPESLAGADLVVALSQSGRSRETVTVIRQTTARTIAVVNVGDSPLAATAGATLRLGDLPDSLASSIGFTASAIAVSMLAEAWSSGRPSTHWASIGLRLEEFLARTSVSIDRVAELLSTADVVDVVAPADQLGLAEEATLLIREVPRVPSACFETRQYLHGLMEATRPTTLHLVYESADSPQVVGPLAALGRQVVVFDTAPAGVAAATVLQVDLPLESPLEAPIFATAFLQQACLRAVREQGIDPDEFLFLESDTKLGDGE